MNYEWDSQNGEGNEQSPTHSNAKSREPIDGRGDNQLGEKEENNE
jgi:hypothetical protein